jgi:DNA-binding PadR family transcriptional regulator
VIHAASIGNTMNSPMTGQTTALSQDDVMLLIADGASGGYPLDPIRLMKGGFIVSEIGVEAWRPLFNFHPYHYGPFDSSVYGAVDRLVAGGLLAATPVGGYNTYAVTDTGHRRAADLEGLIGERAAGWLRRIGRYVTSRSFTDLLKEIYERYPDFAVNSRVR